MRKASSAAFTACLTDALFTSRGIALPSQFLCPSRTCPTSLPVCLLPILTQLSGWHRPKRKGYRNGTYTRDLGTSTGRLADINVPRDREGQFHTQAFERYSRYEPHITEG